MEISNVYLKNKMKIGIIGISGKGKSTFLNHLIEAESAASLNGLVGSKNKESEESGKTKNPVRYYIDKDTVKPSCMVHRLVDDKIEEIDIDLSCAVEYAISPKKCTVIIRTRPSTEFRGIMEKYDLTELEFIDTQGLLDTLDTEVPVPLELRECAVLLYLYNSSDQGSRGDYIKKYRNFLHAISDKPLIFLETDTQWQVTRKEIDECFDSAEEKLKSLDKDYSIPAEDIRIRYSILTGNNDLKNNDTFILTSILSASKSSVNFYKVKLPIDFEDKFFNECIRISSAHTMQEVFTRLSGIKESLQQEFEKAKGKFQYPAAFTTCYGLLNDIFVKEFQRIDYNTNAKVLRFARHDYNRFKRALIALQKGELFEVDLAKINREIHTSYGYHYIYETYKNQDILDSMQLLLDLYKGYLRSITVTGNKLSKSVQVYLARSVSSDFMCRDTGYDIPVLDEKTFIYCMKELKQWIKEFPVETVVYTNYKQFDVEVTQKNSTIRLAQRHVGNVSSMITKLTFLCMCINNKMYNFAVESILDKTRGFIE